ncbi:hypothetical protein L336_0622 [Candidatus Saccharimonas aalborgensis]|uniref:Uncharacterized protein n=1 Tax=Candidatus Saccharimonas aalborgensis TaxID=1332188 RepID=R4PVP9_9BACT|nr:hypothetical protein [Candidatus Saccharimonas aalborgensis]AGL62325.1 hypothetical protein L336_0622 [Candidatus Saccharimonas aalborgensis]QQR51079.1 MAG: hypothetical protein IPF89_04935 [Candidatus Saccharibacteria bacterium]QQS68826.1 MAG: hypothetical protein IPP24_02250 [Candidatus Saccharibacteria bacterium]QQS71111.1 MAG: hypothetical protein IPP92_02380 [Candidatus Saccharibacteria bacterium]
MKNTRSVPGEKPTSDEVDASIAALESLLDRAFCSEDELRMMSHDQRIAASDARLYVVGLFDKVNRLDLEGNCNTNDKSASDETEDDEFYAIVPSPRPSIDRPRQIAWALQRGILMNLHVLTNTKRCGILIISASRWLRS